MGRTSGCDEACWSIHGSSMYLSKQCGLTHQPLLQSQFLGLTDRYVGIDIYISRCNAMPPLCKYLTIARLHTLVVHRFVTHY